MVFGLLGMLANVRKIYVYPVGASFRRPQTINIDMTYWEHNVKHRFEIKAIELSLVNYSLKRVHS